METVINSKTRLLLPNLPTGCVLEVSLTSLPVMETQEDLLLCSHRERAGGHWLGLSQVRQVLDLSKLIQSVVQGVLVLLVGRGWGWRWTCTSGATGSGSRLGPWEITARLGNGVGAGVTFEYLS